MEKEFTAVDVIMSGEYFKHPPAELLQICSDSQMVDENKDIKQVNMLPGDRFDFRKRNICC